MSITSLAVSGLYTIREVAEITHLSTTMVRRLVTNGELPAKRIGRCVRVRRVDLEAWIESLPDAYLSTQIEDEA